MRKMCITEDGRIIDLTNLRENGILEYVDGEWVRPSTSIKGSDIWEARLLSEEEFTTLWEKRI